MVVEREDATAGACWDSSAVVGKAFRASADPHRGPHKQTDHRYGRAHLEFLIQQFGGLRICTSYKFPGDATAGPGSTF